MSKIITKNVCPSIPTRLWDWEATREDWDLGDPIGQGPTEEAAIEDLIEQEQENEIN